MVRLLGWWMGVRRLGVWKRDPRSLETRGVCAETPNLASAVFEWATE